MHLHLYFLITHQTHQLITHQLITHYYSHGHHSSIDKAQASQAGAQDQVAGAHFRLQRAQEPAAQLSVAVKAGHLHQGVHLDPEKTEFGVAQSGAREIDQRYGSDRLYSGRGPQIAGAFDRADPRRPRERPPGRALSYRARQA